MKNKKAFVAEMLVTVIIFVVILYVLLKLSGAIISLIRGIGEGYFLCLFKKVISSLIGISSFCLPVVKTISLTQQESDNVVRIDAFLSKTEIENVKKWYEGKADVYNDNWRLQYKLDREIANGMKRCKGRNGDYELELGKKFVPGLTEPLLYCDLCEVYKFDSSIKDKFKGHELNEFLQRNPIRIGSKVSHWENLKDKSVQTDLKTIRYSTQSDLAIVYTRTNINMIKEFGRDILDILWFYGEEDHPVPVNGIVLISFEDIGKLKCGGYEAFET